ncbi:MAG TPA: hypothetical protein VD998_03465 [Verrucomicrobiae bacterium]|nr:hypothetical protein [Verrucomicrobiae bacterium]
MFGVLLTSIATLFEEVSTAIGREHVLEHKESRFMMGFLDFFFAILFFVFISIVSHQAFYFDRASLPTFLLRAVLELIQLYVTLIAVVQADRSTFGFIRVVTIPLLLIVDLVAGYTMGMNQIMGIGLIIIAVLFLFLDNDFKKKGAWWVLFGAANAVATLSLYKYNITHFNSVAAEQTLMFLILIVSLALTTFFIAKENPVKFLTKKVYIIQSLARGVGTLMESFAFLFAPASVIVAAKRATAVFWSMLAGEVYFHEKHILVKMFMSLLLAGGIVLIVI